MCDTVFEKVMNLPKSWMKEIRLTVVEKQCLKKAWSKIITQHIRLSIFFFVCFFFTSSNEQKWPKNYEFLTILIIAVLLQLFLSGTTPKLAQVNVNKKWKN